MFVNNITLFQFEKKSKYVFLFQSVAGKSRLKCGQVLWALGLAYFSLATIYENMRMSSLYNGANKV